MAAPWWLHPLENTKVFSKTKAALGDYVVFEDELKKLLPPMTEWREDKHGPMSASLFEDTVVYRSATQFEASHAYVSADEKKLAASYSVGHGAFSMRGLVHRMRINIDENVRKVYMAIGNISIWSKEITADDVKNGSVDIGVADSMVPLVLLPYMQTSVVIVTTHESRNALYDAKYELQYMVVFLPYPLEQQLQYDNNVLQYWSSYDVFLRGGTVWTDSFLVGDQF